ncbi:glycosyltransferase [Gemmatimonadota bacterium]
MPLPTVLTFVAHYLPGFKSGGPVRSLANLVDQLGDEFNFRIVTRDRDFMDDIPYQGIELNVWNAVGNAQVLYAAPESLTVSAVIRLMCETPHDVLYLNSFFDPRFTLLPLLARLIGTTGRQPVVLAPRGEFSSGALTLKAWKKRPYISLGRALGLYRRVTWQASSELEAEDISRTMAPPPTKICIASDLPEQVTAPVLDITPHRAPAEALQLVFLSRISPKKNLDFALRVLGRVSIPVEFRIYGVIDDGAYWKRCQKQIRSLPNHIRVRYHGAIPHTSVQSVLAESDLFVLPTRGENYGHVILETLAAGTPALISDQTPWRDLETAGVGWVLPLEDLGPYSAAIESYASLSATERADYRQRAFQYAVQVTQGGQVVDANRALFRYALSS